MAAVSELRRRIKQRDTLLRMIEDLETEPNPERESRLRASLFETERLIETIKMGPKRNLERLRAELEAAEREAQEVARG